MKILNVNFNENVVWSLESALPILQKANPNRTEKELIALLKASKLVKNELPKNTSKSAKGKGKRKADDRNTDNL